MSNTERQRMFRLRHPGYYNKYYAQTKQIKKSAKLEAYKAARAAKETTEINPATMVDSPGMNAMPEHMV